MPEADRIIALLNLKPHPEGGYFRETFRDGAAADGRAHSTAIYFLLKAGEVSRWHRVDAAEVWHFYSGAPLELKPPQQAMPASVVSAHPWVPPAPASVKVPGGGFPRPYEL